jgi:hypothetical protein
VEALAILHHAPSLSTGLQDSIIKIFEHAVQEEGKIQNSGKKQHVKQYVWPGD